LKRRTNSHKPRRKERADERSSISRRRTVEEKREDKYGVPVILEEELEEKGSP